MALAGFDSSYYVQTYPDVLTSVLQGKLTAEQHFLLYGANEGRNPNANFDTKYYATTYPDVVTAVNAGQVANVYLHYINNGGKEGRVPSAALAGFNGAAYLAANKDVADAGYTAANAVSHYVLFGAAEKRPGAGNTQQQVTGNYAGTINDDTVTPAGGQTNAVRVEGGQQGAGGDTLVITSGSASSFQVIDLSNVTGDQNLTRDTQNAKVGPVVQGFENVDASAATIGVNITALDRTSVTNNGGVASTISGSVILGGTSRDTLNGGNGADSINGGDGNDIINGGAGNDTLLGGAGDDSINGGDGNDTIWDGAGNDTILGGAGNDTIYVEAGVNSVDGGADNDTITLKADQGTATVASTVLGGAGNDTIILNEVTAASRVFVSGGVGHDTITAGLGVETVNGGAGNDTIIVTQANINTGDVFNGNDGQDIIQLKIPTGSQTNTFVFQPTGSTAATSQFNGFEAIALVDDSGNASAPKSYKIILTDTFIAQNFGAGASLGAFLIDARGLPGGSNLVIDFSQLSANSAARFGNQAFRVLTSPTTDVRDQNNVTITAAYSVQTGNPLLNNVTAFSVYAGETQIVAGSADAYTADRQVATGAGQAAYTVIGGTPETSTGVSGSGGTFIVNAQGAVLTSNIIGTGASAQTANVPYLSDGNDVITATRLDWALIQDSTTTDADVLNAIVFGDYAATPATITNIETINLVSNNVANFSLGNITGASVINIGGTGIVGTTNFTNIAGKTLGLSSGFTGTLTANGNTAGNDTATLRLDGANAAFVTDLGAAATDTLTLNVTGNSTISSFTAGDATLLTTSITGSGNLTLTTATGFGGVFNAGGTGTSAYTGNLSFTGSNAAVTVTGGAGNDTITGSTAADVIRGGAGNDVITTGATGADTIYGGTGADTITLTTPGTNYVVGIDRGDSGVFTAPTVNAAISTLNFDVITGANAADIVFFSSLTTGYGSVGAAAANGVLVNAASLQAGGTLVGVVADNTLTQVRGTYDTTNKLFTAAATGADSLLVYDANAALGSTAYEAVVLVGFVSAAGTVAAGAGGVQWTFA